MANHAGVETTTNQNHFAYKVLSTACARPTRAERNRKWDNMKNPFGDQQIPGSYHNLKERMYKKVSAKVDDQIFEVVQTAYEKALQDENVVLSRPERQRLFAQILKLTLEDMIKKLDARSSSA